MEPPTPIEELYKQLHTGQKFAAQGGEEITDSQLVRIGYDNIHKTGLFEKACSKWRRQPITDKTWAKFQTFFTLEVTDYLKNNTADEAQYSAAQVQELHDQNVAALTIAVNTSPSDPTQTPIANTTSPPQAANAITANDIETIVNAILQRTNNNSKGNTSTTNGDESKKTKKIQVAQGFNTTGEPISYCWSHGITKNLRHNSMACRRKKEGHQDKATLTNKMNGSEQVCEKRE